VSRDPAGVLASGDAVSDTSRAAATATGTQYLERFGAVRFGEIEDQLSNTMQGQFSHNVSLIWIKFELVLHD
jgi:hypothetical protein